MEAGFPSGCVSIAPGDRETGYWLSKNSKLSRLIFTGSVSAGAQVMAQAAENLTPVTLELGGKDAAIVLPDAPPEWTANGLIWSAFTNCGQACASVERVYIVDGPNTTSLIKHLVHKTSSLQLGSGLDDNTEVGPLISQEQLDKVAMQVQQAESLGAKVLCGGKRRPDLGGYFYEPTVLTNVNHTMAIMNEETFGPVLPVMIVSSEEEAITHANDSRYGLSASVWSKNLSAAEDVAEDLEVGTVTVNDSMFAFACPQAPWGGLKKSGVGRTHSYFGLLDLVNIKHISVDASGGSHRQWWYPYNRSRLKVARAGLSFLHGSSLIERLHGAFDFVINSVFK